MRLTITTVINLALYCAPLAPISAYSAIVFDLGGPPTNPATVRVLQNLNGMATFTATLSMASTENAFLQIPDNNTFAIAFVGGDNQDKVTSASVTGGTCYTFVGGAPNGSRILQPGQNCTIAETFVTSDPRNPDPDNDVGNWTVTGSFTMKGATTAMVTAPKTTVINANVLDTPEPSTLMLLGAGLVFICILKTRKTCVSSL